MTFLTALIRESSFNVRIRLDEIIQPDRWIIEDAEL